MANQCLLIWESQPSRGSAASDDEGFGLHHVLTDLESERTLAEVCSSHMRQSVFRTEALGLAPHVRDQLRPLNSFRKSWEVFYEGGQRKLAAGLVPFQHQGIQLCARGVKRCCVPGATRSDDDNISCIHRVG